MTPKLRQQVLERDNYSCAVCKQHYEKHQLVVHHIKPLSLGGEDKLDNMIAVCKSHHAPSEPKELWNGRIVPPDILSRNIDRMIRSWTCSTCHKPFKSEDLVTCVCVSKP